MYVCGEYHSALAESSPQPSRKIRGSQQKKKVAQNALSTWATVYLYEQPLKATPSHQFLYTLSMYNGTSTKGI